jgi:hypothetical protein
MKNQEFIEQFRSAWAASRDASHPIEAEIREEGDSDGADELRDARAQVEAFMTSPPTRESRYLIELERTVKNIKEFFSDAALDTNNHIYLNRMVEVRSLQKKHMKIDAILATDDLDSIGELLSETDQAILASFDDEPTRRTWLEAKSQVLQEEAKTALGAANYFASEAYLSEGPLQHIVNMGQGGRADVMDKLKPEHLLESMNEQLGDFLKDVHHHKGRDGEAFYQTSKYLSRLYEGIHLLRVKLDQQGITLDLGADAQAKSITIKDQLVKIRGAKGPWAKATDEAKARHSIELAREIYGVDTMAALKTNILREVQAINGEVRSKLTMRAGTEETREYFQKRDPRKARLRGGRDQ